MNAYITANLMFQSVQRPGAIRNMTISEYNNRAENDEDKGSYLIKVARHKTAAKGPARVIANKETSTLMNFYLQNVRTVIKPLCKEYESRFFLTPTGNELKNLSEAISKVATVFNIESPTSTIHRKVVQTETKKHKAECIDQVCVQMSHSRATCENYHQHTSTEESFAVQKTIEELCYNKYFAGDQSDIIKLEWPLDSNNTIPLVLCRQLSKKYKRLQEKTDRQIQDHWKHLKKRYLSKH